MTPPPVEVRVLGGGPAGCAAARLLALWGHAVLLVTRPARSPAPPLAESIPPSTAKLFDVLGVTELVNGAGVVRSTGNTVWWGGDAARVERFAAGARGWQVSAARLDAVLLRAAEEAGVRVERRRATAADAAAPGAAFTLDATGRAGLLARARGLRQWRPGLRTVALVARWRPGSAFDSIDATHTILESYADGWAWSVPDADGHRHVAVMVDPRTSNLARGGAARDVYRAEVAKTRQLGALVAGAELVDGPTGWDASIYSASRAVDGSLLLVGDAASFIDPLSSAGVQKALASGWLAAVAVHTALIRPAMRPAALEFFAAREAEVFDRLHRLTRRHFGAGAAVSDHPFWADRATGPDDEAADEGARLRAAFERLRDASGLALRLHPAIRIEPRPAVAGSEIVFERRVIAPGAPDGVRYLRDVDLIVLLELAPAADEVGTLFETYCRHAGPTALPDFLAALATAVSREWLVPQD